MVEHEIELVVMVSKLHIRMIDELYMAASTMSNDLWYDPSATIHVCNYKNHFKNYKVVEDKQKVIIRNYNVAKVMRKGSIELNFTSRKKLLFVNVLHVPDIRKNLVYANLLCNKGFKVVLKFNKIILYKNRLFVRKCYSYNEMFKLIINNKFSVSIYMIELSLSLWHNHLAHISFRSLRYMAKYDLIS